MNKYSFLLVIALGLGALLISCEKERYEVAGEEQDSPIIEQTDVSMSSEFASFERSTSNSEGNVAIKVYQYPDGSERLLVYNPLVHNMFIYGEEEYQVIWVKDYAKVGDSEWLDNICRGTYEVKVYHSDYGFIGETTYFSNAVCTY